MQIFVLLILLVLGIYAINTGYLPLLFISGIGIYVIATSKNADRAIDSFFAFCFFGGILAIIIQAITS